MNFSLQKYKQSLAAHSSTQSVSTTKSINGILYPDNATYALKRRMIVPKWWVESVLLTLGKKCTWYGDFIADHFDKRVYEYFKATSTNMFFMIFLWDELVRKMFAAPNHKISHIKIDLTKFLLGTEKQNASILKKLEENLAKPIKIFNVTQIDETKESKLTKNGYLNIFKKVSLKEDVNGIWLTLHFAQKISNIFGSPDVKPQKSSFKNSFITINPNLFYEMGSRVNLKKALNGLFLEYNKQNETLDPLHTAFNIEATTLPDFHSLVSSTSETLYNHGILSISSTPPPMKISDIKKRQKVSSDEEQSPFVFGWGLSSQSKEARNFEAKLSQQLNTIRHSSSAKQLFREPPQDELHKARISHPNLTEIQIHPSETKMQQGASERRVEPPQPSAKAAQRREPHTQATNNDAASSFSMGIESAQIVPSQPITPQAPASEPPKPTYTYVPPQKPNFQAFSERELSIFVTRFYETLNPKQKKMFEHERQNMTREQFRSFMIPILQRNHASLTA